MNTTVTKNPSIAKKWILLNNEIMTKDEDEFRLHKDKEAVRSYFLDYVNKNTDW